MSGNGGSQGPPFFYNCLTSGSGWEGNIAHVKIIALKIALVACLIACFGTSVRAGEITAPEGILKGMVLDEKGRPLPGAIVRVKGPDGKKREVESQPTGRFILFQLPPGIYTVVVVMTGFDAVKMDKVEIKNGQMTVVEIRVNVADNCCVIRSALPNPIDTTSSITYTHIKF